MLANNSCRRSDAFTTACQDFERLFSSFAAQDLAVVEVNKPSTKLHSMYNASESDSSEDWSGTEPARAIVNPSSPQLDAYHQYLKAAPPNEGLPCPIGDHEDLNTGHAKLCWWRDVRNRVPFTGAELLSSFVAKVRSQLSKGLWIVPGSNINRASLLFCPVPS